MQDLSKFANNKTPNFFSNNGQSGYPSVSAFEEDSKVLHRRKNRERATTV